MSDHQFQLFGFQPPRAPKKKITKEMVEEAKRLFESGDHKLCASKVRDIREELERKYGV